jgi:hypothetical protein
MNTTNSRYIFAVFCLIFIMPACSTGQESENSEPEPEPAGEFADIVSVEASGSSGDYTFEVGISSPDTGCEQYADWWEVVSEDEQLIYRRILAHSHVEEQPSERSGGAVEIDTGQTVWIRAHMNNSGYGGAVYKGSIDDGFEAAESDSSFAALLEQEPPQPDGCAF